VRFQCSHCRGILAIDDGEPGEAVACGHCGMAVAIPQTRASPGAIVGDFIIQERLGEGGMGTVYLAHQISLDRAAALKVLHARYGADSAYIQDFVREARAAAAINHPNIVQAYAVGEDEGLFYFAMEYVPGSTLKQVLLHGGRMVADRALSIAEQVAGALDYAWRSQGLVHRDIKPDNIILTADGGVKLADLGLARKLTDTASDGSQELYGTPQYIAPEHLLGSPGDNRSDIYSLGATLFHALTGRFPYEGSSPAEIAQRHLSDPLPPVQEVCPEVPAPVAQVVEVMLSKRAEHRYPDAAALLADLRALRQGGTPSATPDPASQQPIDLYSDEATAIGEGQGVVAPPVAPPAGTVTTTPPKPAAAAPGKRRFSVSKTLPPPLQAPGAATPPAVPEAAAPVAPEATPEGVPAAMAAASEAGAEGVGEAAAAEEAPRGMPVKLMVVVAAAAVLILVGGAVTSYLLWGRDGGEAAGGGATTPTTDAGQAAAAGVAAALGKVRDDIAQARPEAEIRSRLAAIVTEFGFDHPEAENLAALAAPYVEKDLEAARQPLLDAERAQWEQLATAAKAKAAEAEAKAKREAEAAAEAKRQEEEQARLAQQKAQRATEMARQKQEVRAQAAELCRKNQFDEASRLFVPLTTAREDELKQWAELRQNLITLSKKLMEAIVNSKDKLAGLAVPVPAQPKVDWRVARIGFKDVELQARRVTYVKGKREEEMETLEIPFADLSPVQLDRLTEKKWETDGADESERKLLFGAYLLAREQYVSEIRKRLEACGRPEAGPLLEELTAIEPELRKAEVEKLVEQLKQCVQQGNKRQALAMFEYLQRQFPEEAEALKNELRELIGEP